MAAHRLRSHHRPVPRSHTQTQNTPTHPPTLTHTHTRAQVHPPLPPGCPSPPLPSHTICEMAVWAHLSFFFRRYTCVCMHECACEPTRASYLDCRPAACAHCICICSGAVIDLVVGCVSGGGEGAHAKHRSQVTVAANMRARSVILTCSASTTTTASDTSSSTSSVTNMPSCWQADPSRRARPYR